MNFTSPKDVESPKNLKPLSKQRSRNEISSSSFPIKDYYSFGYESKIEETKNS